jgi:hypothetical protein
MHGFSQAHPDLGDHLPLLPLLKHLCVQRTGAVIAINADLLQMEHILMLRLLEPKVFQSR